MESSAASRRSAEWPAFGGDERAAEGKVPDIVAGDLSEAAGLNRYRWVTGALPFGEVLDAGCGLARGATLLSDGGRRKVVAVDQAREVLEAATPLVPAHVTLQQADVHFLPFESRRFHGVVAFELLDHVQDPLRVLGELTRVLRTDGVLAVSVSNWEAADECPGRAHQRSPSPSDIVEALRARLPHVAVWYECSWMASAILMPDDLEQNRELIAPVVQVSGRLRPEAAPTLLLLASMEPLAPPAWALVLAHPLELRRWSLAWAEQEQRLHQALARIEELESRAARVRELQARLLEAEQAAGSLPQLQQAIRRVADEKRSLEHEMREVRARLAAIERSLAWRITAPARRVVGLVRRGMSAVERVERLLARVTERGILEHVEDIVQRIQKRLG